VSVLRSLKWIFWGALLAMAVWIGSAGLFNNAGFFNGVLGYAMVAVGMIGLAGNSFESRHGLLIKPIAIVSLLNAFWAPFAECAGVITPVAKSVGLTLDILNVLAAIGFCVAMRQLCATTSLKRAESSWRRNLLLWRVGLPASVGAACLSLWAARNEVGAISPDYTPRSVMIPLVVLCLIALVVWMHFVVSLWRTIAGLKGMVKRLPSASDFGLDQQASIHFQFSIPGLLIIIAATAVIVLGHLQRTILFWHLTMAMLVGLSLLATWLDRRTLGEVLLVVVATVLVTGYAQLTKHSQSDRICGTNVEPGYDDADYQLSDSFLADIGGWLVTRGYESCQPAPDSVKSLSLAPRCRDLPVASEPRTAVWYRGGKPTSQGVRIRILYSKTGQYLHFVAVDYDWVVVDFPSAIRERERTLKRFTEDAAARWQEYLKGQRKDRPKP
jgi:hypothetical protein